MIYRAFRSARWPWMRKPAGLRDTLRLGWMPGHGIRPQLRLTLRVTVERELSFLESQRLVRDVATSTKFLTDSAWQSSIKSTLNQRASPGTTPEAVLLMENTLAMFLLPSTKFTSWIRFQLRCVRFQEILPLLQKRQFPLLQTRVRLRL